MWDGWMGFAYSEELHWQVGGGLWRSYNCSWDFQAEYLAVSLSHEERAFSHSHLMPDDGKRCKAKAPRKKNMDKVEFPFRPVRLRGEKGAPKNWTGGGMEGIHFPIAKKKRKSKAIKESFSGESRTKSSHFFLSLPFFFLSVSVAVCVHSISFTNDSSDPVTSKTPCRCRSRLSYSFNLPRIMTSMFLCHVFFNINNRVDTTCRYNTYYIHVL